MGVARLHDLQLDWLFTQCLVPHVWPKPINVILSVEQKDVNAAFFSCSSAAFHAGPKTNILLRLPMAGDLRKCTEKYFYQP